MFKNIIWVAEMAQRLRVCTVPAENLGLFPGVHMETHNLLQLQLQGDLMLLTRAPHTQVNLCSTHRCTTEDKY